jgi:hydroxymethylpyrimidine pyrophosphatase-like HAD family hydrolase
VPHCFCAVVVDYDGTIARHDRAHPEALRAIAELRRRGRTVLLCTGRIVEDLRAVFPDVDRHFDAIIAENGAVVMMDSRLVHAADPLPAELAAGLRGAGIPHREGHVLLATDAAYDDAVLDVIVRLGLEAQLVYNRGALMVLPAGVSKGSGVVQAFGLLEVSRHSAISIGDAENDHSLLTVCEVGVAVSDAVPALLAHADICLERPNGEGVAAFLRGPVLHGAVRVHAERWHIELGRTEAGTVARLPGSNLNVLIAGASCSGKSHMAGLLVERLVAHDYAVCVLDTEGDHGALAELPGVVALGGSDPLPSPARLATLIRHRFSSVVVDLSLLPMDAKRDYCLRALRVLEQLRRDRGVPHWIVIEEADQMLLSADLSDADGLTPSGYCLVTHRPLELGPALLAAIDVVIALPGAERYAHLPPGDADTLPRGEQPFLLQPGQALLAGPDGVLTFETALRSTRHVRHQHKYTWAQVSPERRFFFTAPDGGVRAAGNLREFRDEVARADEVELRTHLQAGDFSRWTRDVLADDELGARLRGIERWFLNDAAAAVDPARAAVIAAIDDRYL